jgi:hypothetical protein
MESESSLPCLRESSIWLNPFHMINSCLFKPNLVIIYALIYAQSPNILSSLRVFWLKNYMNLFFPCLLHYRTYHALWFNRLNEGNIRTAQESFFLQSYATNTCLICLLHSICNYSCETKYLPHTSFQDQVRCSCAVFKQWEISFYTKYWNIVYFKGTAVSLQGFMIVAVARYLFHKLSLSFYFHLNCHKFWYSSTASDINWTWARESSVNTSARSIEEKLKALCRFYYSSIFIVLGRVLFL